MRNFNILKLYRSPDTIFTAKDIALLVGETDLNILKSRINYYARTKKLIALRRGIYAKDEKYSRFELATKIYTPAYISLETVLQKEGIVFQHYQAIFVVSYLSREIVCDNQSYVYKKIKNEALTNLLGIEQQDNYFTATKERAFLDALYLYRNYHFDNLKTIDWELCFQILPIYRQKNMSKTVDLLYKESKNA